MDRRVKERLIGASILVALIVLVVPELLSGPKTAVPSATPPATFPANAPEPTRNVTLDLATSKATANSEADPAETQGSAASAVSAAKGGEASPVAPAPASPASAAPASTEPASASPTVTTPVETAVPSPISARANWAVQLGSFASRANADNLSRQSGMSRAWWPRPADLAFWRWIHDGIGLRSGRICDRREEASD
jgi:DedD protein